jgi:hypothetical protein
MLDFKTQSQLLDASATIVRSYLRAATNTFAASASRSMSLWSEMLEAASPCHAPAERMSWAPLVQTWWLGPSMTFWAPLADWRAWGRAPFTPFPAWSGWPAQMPPATPRASSNSAPKRAADEGGFSTYRSSGGHASSQVIMGTAPSRTNGRAAPSKRP